MKKLSLVLLCFVILSGCSQQQSAPELDDDQNDFLTTYVTEKFFAYNYITPNRDTWTIQRNKNKWTISFREEEHGPLNELIMYWDGKHQNAETSRIMIDGIIVFKN